MNPSGNNLAQLFLQLLCTSHTLLGPEVCLLTHYPAAAKLNKEIHFEGLRICGLLTDLTLFRFYSYDPSTENFCMDKEFTVNNKRKSFSSDMIQSMSLFHMINVS